MTGPQRHKRPPNQFRRTSLIVMAIVTTMVVALGVGTASAELRGDRNGDGRNASQRDRGGQNEQPADPEATESVNPDESAEADPSAPAEGEGDQGEGDQGEGQGEGDQGEGEGDQGEGEADQVNNDVDPNDFIDINQVPPGGNNPALGRRNTFKVQCAFQADHHNSDNVIAAPGVTNGAHHVHDYTGNLTTDANSTDESLEASGTSCAGGDKSAYFWPVIRDVTEDTTARFPGELEEDLNTGALLVPKFTIQFKGNPKSKVVAMPKFLRVLTGDAKTPVNGGANQRAKFTCTGFTNRITTDKYPLCPNGRGMTRIAEFPSCWDGENTDSANHRTHILFPDQQGNCPEGTQAVPKLVITMTYNVKPGPTFRLDSFPESTHEPNSDHNDFLNVMSDELMARVVNCVNTGRGC
jgi:hypothetical protein